METTIHFTCTPDEIKQIFIEGLREFESERENTTILKTTYSINQVAKQLGRSHSTITKMIEEGILKTTSDQRRIKAISLIDYLKSNNKK